VIELKLVCLAAELLGSGWRTWSRASVAARMTAMPVTTVPPAGMRAVVEGVWSVSIAP
jgi:hypothetical protein